MATAESSPQPPDADSYREKLRSLAFGGVPGGNRPRSKGLRKPTYNNGWERGIKGEHRPDGSFMPYVDEHLEPIRMKKWSENKRGYDTQLDQLRQPDKD